MKSKIFTVLCVGWLSVAATAHGTPIQGEADFGGGGFTKLSLIGGSDFLSATGINFSSGLEYFKSRTGDFLPVSPGTLVKFANISFGSIPSVPLWDFASGGKSYSFTLSSLAIDNRTRDTISLEGGGTLKISGLEATLASWRLDGDINRKLFTFSSEASSTRIAAPEIDASSGTSAIALLAGVLLLLAENSRHRARSQARASSRGLSTRIR